MIRNVVVGLLKMYKAVASPIAPPACRFEPSCSVYAAESIERHGVARGLLRALGRLLKCHPFHPGGYDPVT